MSRGPSHAKAGWAPHLRRVSPEARGVLPSQAFPVASGPTPRPPAPTVTSAAELPPPDPGPRLLPL